ncbi:hypothetical protein AAFF_G00193770 [Aldrovandia affinis]|uniref:Uncharacterized protein n=1 Tax=Aldrovandia affinis TaxID=143900 RepID=A0AAD7WVH4_9TELE|nr:hypothetical protein AAFF_G00193770 [Aldrovandia affinis]
MNHSGSAPVPRTPPAFLPTSGLLRTLRWRDGLFPNISNQDLLLGGGVQRRAGTLVLTPREVEHCDPAKDAPGEAY